MSFGDLGEEGELPGAAAGVAREAGDLHLMHGEDHRRRSAGAAEDRRDVDDVGDARAVAAEFEGNQHAQQPLLADGGEGFGREARVAVDSVGVQLGDRRGSLGAGDEVARSRRFAGSGACGARRERAYVEAHEANSQSRSQND